MKRVTIFIFIIIIFSSCTSVKISSATKNIVYSGIKNGKNTMNYQIVFNSKMDFSINVVLLEGNLIEKYSVQNIKTKVFESVSKNLFKAGAYKIIFKTSDINKDNKMNIVTLNIKQNGNDKVFKTTVINAKNEHRK